MKIAIVGGGAIGLLFAHYLNQYHRVVLYVRNDQQRVKIHSEGIILHKQNMTNKALVECKDISEWGQDDEDLSIICVKQYQLLDLLKHSSMPENHPLLFVQNGMGHLKWLERLKSDCILVGSVEHGAYRMNENSVVHTGVGITKIALYKGMDDGIIGDLIDPLQSTFPFQIEEDFYVMLKKKLIVNAIINPLTAVLRVKNGELLENPHYQQIFNKIFAEIKGILQLDKEQLYYDNVVHVCRNTSENRSSMLKDLEENRKTEVDAILGYLIEEAENNHVSAPLVNTFYHMIKGIEIKGGEE